MLPHYDVIAVVPVGPGSDPFFVRDTIESFLHFTSAPHKVLILDDSMQNIGEAVREKYPDVDVLRTKKSSGGTLGGLYVSLSHAFKYLLERYSFKLVLKLDTDALLIAPGVDKDALQLFDTLPNTAIAGQFPLDYNGDPWDIGFPRDRIINGTTTWKGIKRPFANLVLRKLHRQALKNGYKTGESVFGGAYFLSVDFLRQLDAAKLLPEYRIRTLNLGEDHLFSLLAKTVGMDLGSLSGENQPFACAWKSLPASPEQLLAEGRKVVHSTREWNDVAEDQIREYFRSIRTLPEINSISTVGFRG